MEVERAVEAGVIDVDGVRVLHGELADPQEAGLGAGLVAELGLDLVPHLRQVPVGGEFQPDEGDDLFVGHAEDQVGSLAVDEAEHFVAHRLPAPRLLPDGGRMHGGKQQFLGADGVHLLADHLGDLAMDAPTQWQHGVVTRLELTDEAATYQQSVAERLGVGRGVAQCRNEQGRPAHRPCLLVGDGLRHLSDRPPLHRS